MHDLNVHPFQHERAAACYNQKQHPVAVYNIQLSATYSSEPLALAMPKNIWKNALKVWISFNLSYTQVKIICESRFHYKGS